MKVYITNTKSITGKLSGKTSYIVEMLYRDRFGNLLVESKFVSHDDFDLISSVCRGSLWNADFSPDGRLLGFEEVKGALPVDLTF